MNWGDLQRYRWLAGLSVAGFTVGFVPGLQAQDVAWFRLNGLPQVSVGVDAEGSTERTKNAGGSSTYENLSLTPFVGLHTAGSVYHPNLLAFDLGGELGWGWNSTSGSGQATRLQSAELLRYLAEFNLLSTQPCTASFYAAQDHTFTDYGTFNTYTVDATRYGGRANWAVGNFTLNADLGYRNQTASGLTDTSETTEEYLNFLGIHKRKFGQTTLTLNANTLENVLNYGSRLDTTSWSLGVSDSETLGSRHQLSAATSLNYSQSEFSGQQLNTLSASENLILNHRHNLDSYLQLNYHQSEFSQITSSRVQGTAGLRHQLYESLTSSLEGHGTHELDTAATGNSTYDLYGVGLNESYTKRLQSWGQLSLGTGVTVNHQDQNSPAGLQTWFDEPHTIYQSASPVYQKIFLSHPRVSIVLAVKVGNTPLPPSDYQLVPSGELAEVQIVPSPSVSTLTLMTNGSLAVTITYQSQSLGSSAYDTIGYSTQLRLDLWHQVGIYGRLNWQDNNAPPTVLTQTLTDLVGGVDYRRKWFRTGAEYESYDSNFTQYQSLRFFQNFNFVYTDASSLGIDFNETFYHYPARADQSQYQFMSHYNTRLPLSLTWYVDGGGLLQEITGTEQIQGVARTGIGWSRGKLSLRVGYEFNSQSTESGGFTDERIKHRFFTYLRRSF